MRKLRLPYASLRTDARGFCLCILWFICYQGDSEISYGTKYFLTLHAPGTSYLKEGLVCCVHHIRFHTVTYLIVCST